MNTNNRLNETVDSQTAMQPGQGMPYQGGMQPGMQQGMPYQGGMQPGMQQGQGMQPGMPMQQGMPYQQGQGMQPGMPMQPNTGFYNFRGLNMQFVNDPMVVLSNAKRAHINQQVELLEVLSGCETKNRYHIFIETMDKQYLYLFKAKEESGCCSRQCLSSETRPLHLNIKHMSSASAINEFDSVDNYAVLDKPFKCTCYCLDRPKMKNYVRGNQIGSVKQPFICCNCDPVFYVYDSSDDIKYKIRTSCCQCGIMCKGSLFGECSSVCFGIYEKNETHFVPDNMIGYINKKSGDIEQLLTDADSFVLEFPQNATPEDKMNLIASVLMIDYQYFEDNGKNYNDRY